MDTSQTFLPTKPSEEISTAETPDFFDFVEPQTESTTSLNRSLKTLGIFVESNNNHNEHNNNSSEKMLNKDCQFDTVFGTGLLDDMGWSEWKNTTQETTDDPGVYTLTVLNSSDAWYKVPEEPPPSTSKQKTELDLDCFLDAIPPENNNFFYNQSQFKNEYFEDSGYCEAKDNNFCPSYWKNDTNNNSSSSGQDSLLRSALQGKGIQKSYACSAKYTEPFPPDEKRHLDEIFKEINTLTDELGKSAEVFSHGIQGPINVGSLTSSVNKANKKYSKRSSQLSVSSVKNGVRKERSLHYCSICNKGFKDKYSVNVHVRTHTGEKPFTCSLCGKSFRQKAHLAKHYQTHVAQSQKHHHLNNGSCSKSKKSLDHR